MISAAFSLKLFDKVLSSLLKESAHEHRGSRQPGGVYRVSWCHIFTDLPRETDTTAERDHQSAVWPLSEPTPVRTLLSDFQRRGLCGVHGPRLGFRLVVDHRFVANPDGYPDLPGRYLRRIRQS